MKNLLKAGVLTWILGGGLGLFIILLILFKAC